MPYESSLDRYYDSVGAEYRMSSTRRERVLAMLDESIESLEKPMRVLDIGVGGAEIPQHIRSKHADKGIRVTGVDISQKLLDERRSHYTETQRINVDSAGWQEVFDSRFDIVVLSELIEHLFRPDIFLKSLRDVLEDGAMLVVSTPNMLLWSQRIKFLLGRHAFAEGGVFEWGHIHLFSWPFLKKNLNDAGFKIVSTYHLLHPNALNGLHKVLPPGLFAFQFIVLARKT